MIIMKPVTGNGMDVDIFGNHTPFTAQSVQCLVCSVCGAEADASCNCGATYLPAEVRALAAIKNNPDMSDRALADKAGVSHPTIANARKKATGNDLPDDGNKRIGKDGKARRLPHNNKPRKWLPIAAVSVFANTSPDKLKEINEALTMAMKPYTGILRLKTKTLDEFQKMLETPEQKVERERKEAEQKAERERQQKAERERLNAEEAAKRVEQERKAAEKEAAFREMYPLSNKDFTLSKETRAVLKNFSSINNSIIFRPGNALAVVDQNESIIARAKITDTIPDRFAVGDVAKFLKILNQYGDEATLLVSGSKSITIKNGGEGKFNFTLGAEKGILTTEKDETTIPPIVAEFILPAADLVAIKKNIKLMGLNTIVFVADGKTLSVNAFNIGNSTSNEYEAVLGVCDKKFSVAFSGSKIIGMLENDYDVEITDKEEGVVKIVKFKSENGLEYFIPPLSWSRIGAEVA